MASAPNDRKYLVSHEWHQLAGDIVTIGITQIAADELTDAVGRLAAAVAEQSGSTDAPQALISG